MTNAFKQLVESVKFWTLVLGLLATLLAKYGIHVDDSTAQMIAAGFALLLGAQAATDHGKAAAIISAKAANDNLATTLAHDREMKTMALKQAGFSSVLMMVVLAVIAAASFVVLACGSGCHSMPAPIQDVINCAEQDQGQINQLEAKCAAEIPDWAKVESCAVAALPTVGYQIGSCVVADIVEQFLVKKGATVPVNETYTPKGMLEDFRARYGHKATVKSHGLNL